MGLIKANAIPAASVALFSMGDIEQQAKAVLLKARKQAEQLLEAAQHEADQLRAEAKADGMAQGQREGFSKGSTEGRETGRAEALAKHDQELRKMLAAVTAAAGLLEAGRGDLESSALQEVVSLSIAIARRVTKRQGLLDPNVLTDNLHEALKLAIHASDVRILVNPSERQTMEQVMPRLSFKWPNLKHITLETDAAISPGGCRVVTRHGEVDADLDAQLDRVVAELLPTPPEK